MKKFLKEIEIDGKKYKFYSLTALAQELKIDLKEIPNSIKVLLENLMRHCDGEVVTESHVNALAKWGKSAPIGEEISYYPARVLMQDFTGVPAVVDLAAMRDAMKELGGDTNKINPLTQVDLVIDHSVSVEHFANDQAFKKNVEIEFNNNKERYQFLSWGQKTFANFRVVPPGTGICHQVNLEHLAKVVWSSKDESGIETLYPDTLVGTDSHTTMINGLSVLGWGVGGIEAEAAMLGQPVTMLVPEVIGVKLEGTIPPSVTSTDIVLEVVRMLRVHGVVGKFVEFYGPGLKTLSLADRTTLANMGPEYGATCGFFPVDEETIKYLELTARDPHLIKVVQQYTQEQGLWRDEDDSQIKFSKSYTLDLSSVVPSVSGPKRPQDKIALTDVTKAFSEQLKTTFKKDVQDQVEVSGKDYTLQDGSVVLAAITSCTNTSNPSVMLAAGLVAKKAVELGLMSKPWVKTSLAPGSQVVTDYLNKAGLTEYLNKIGFNLVGYGCTTCIGNSGPLPIEIAEAIHSKNLVACSVLSGNRNFEGRIGPDIRANFLASPPLVVIYALTGTLHIDITKDAIGENDKGEKIYLKDLWPSQEEINKVLESCISRSMFEERYKNVFLGSEDWQSIKTAPSPTYSWSEDSTFIRKVPFFEGMTKSANKEAALQNIDGAKILLLLGDSVTTDHISPAGNIAKQSPAGEYLLNNNVPPKLFNSYGSRRGNHEVMMRGTFANIRIRNLMLDNVEGGHTKNLDTNEQMPVFNASSEYISKKTPLIVIAGKEYGTGSSRDWAAKGTRLLGVKAVIAESFERIHRSNLIGMGVLPLEFISGESRTSLKITGEESFSIEVPNDVRPKQMLAVSILYKNGDTRTTKVLLRIDTENELNYYINGGILPYVIRKLL